MYDFERPTKLELIGFVHPNYRKQYIGTTLLQTAMKEIRLRGRRSSSYYEWGVCFWESICNTYEAALFI